MTDPFPPRRPLSEEQIHERLMKCYEILLEATRGARLRAAAPERRSRKRSLPEQQQEQQPERLRLVPRAGDATLDGEGQP